MEWIFVGLAKLLGSAGFGTVFGGIMGIFNRKTDLQYKKLEYEDHEKQRAHELRQRELDATIMEKEWAARVQVAQVEAEGRIESEAYAAMAKSYEFANPERGTRMAAFSAFVRPFISLAYFIISSIGAAFIIYHGIKQEYSVIQWYELTNFVIEWVAFMAGTTIGYWYAARAGKAPQLSGRK